MGESRRVNQFEEYRSLKRAVRVQTLLVSSTVTLLVGGLYRVSNSSRKISPYPAQNLRCGRPISYFVGPKPHSAQLYIELLPLPGLWCHTTHALLWTNGSNSIPHPGPASSPGVSSAFDLVSRTKHFRGTLINKD